MALVPCAECGFLAQDNAFSCPRCGRRLAPVKKRTPTPERVAAARSTATTPLVVVLVAGLVIIWGSTLRWALITAPEGTYRLEGLNTAGTFTAALGASLTIAAIIGLIRRSVTALVSISIFGLSGTAAAFGVISSISLINPSEYVRAATESSLQIGLWLVFLGSTVGFFTGFAVDAYRRVNLGATRVTQGWRSILWVGVAIAVVVIVVVISNQLGNDVAGTFSEVITN